MPRDETQEAISSRAVGVLFFAGFGSLWLIIGLAAMHRLHIVGAAVVVAVLGLLVIPAMRLLRAASQAPAVAAGTKRESEISRAFTRINTIQWLAVAAAIILLNVLKQPVFIPAAIAIIVGLHLFPLARLFRYNTHYVTGSLLVLWPLGAAALLPREEIPSICSLGTAVILLGSAAYTLTGAMRAG